MNRAFETLLIYVRNVARDPDEDKYRKIRLSNPAFKVTLNMLNPSQSLKDVFHLADFS